MTELPVFTLADLEAQPRFDLPDFTRDDAIDLGLIAVALVRERAANLAVRIVRRGEEVFVARLGTTGAENDPWLAGKAAVAERFGEPSLLVRRRHEAAGTPFEERSDIDHELLRAHGGAIPVFVGGELLGTITMSGEPDVADHAASAEALRRFLARGAPAS
ncbi:MAG TPA: heme-binding protein [Microbacterium sp.]|nr:heme-binding protein [Microbacterium sp.]